MLIARAPVRVSLAGGGTDLPAYYERHGGKVISTSINKYFYVFVSFNSAEGVQVSSADYRSFYRHRSTEPSFLEGDLGLVKAVLQSFGLTGGVSLFLASEVPPGTGLGSSSAVSVALVKALSTLMGQHLRPAEVAARACSLEIDVLKFPVGKQDQYAAAFGGLNRILFNTAGVTVEPLGLPRETKNKLEHNLLLFFTGSTRDANKILTEQRRATLQDDGGTVAALHAIRASVDQAERLLLAGDLRGYAEYLADSWEHKKRLASGVSSPFVDETYELARQHGALGGKLTGAGGGGFLLLYCEEPHQEAVTRLLEARGLYRMDYRFEQGGARVLLDALPRSAWQSLSTETRQLQHAG